MSKADKATLQAALKDLESNAETVRERAVKSIRAAFDRKATAIKLAQDGGKLTWMILFQGMFQAYQTQLEKCISKLGLATVLADTDARDRSMARLAEIVATLRLLVDRTKEVLNKSVRRALYKHLSTAFIRGGKLIALVAADYASATASMLSWKPHLQSLPNDTWHVILATSFNIVLNLPPTGTLLDGFGTCNVDDSSLAQEDVSMSSTSNGGSPASYDSSRRKRQRETEEEIPSKSKILRPSAAQLNFMKVISILLRSPTAPILSDPTAEPGDPHAFPRRLLSYFDYFLRIYPVDTSLRREFLSALSASLGHFTLNCRMLVAAFAASNSWDSLVSMWGAKDQDKNDNIVVVLRQLFPVRVAAPVDNEPHAVPVKSLAMLWSTAEEVINKHGSALLLDTLRLRLRGCHDRASTELAFVSETFEYGWGFEKEQALAWAVLELQADCAEKLYVHAESICYIVTDHGKRRRTDNPISMISESLKSQSRSKGAQQRKVHHLQVLLFFIEKHWSTLHGVSRKDLILSLTSLVSFEHTDIQSWTFLCLAAIAQADSTLPSSAGIRPLDVSALWDPIWTHAIRRTNAPAVSRAACHAAHALLLHSKRFLSPQRVLAEIESFVKDLDVQGPVYPYDSVCDFMILCLRVANQDVRLYRLQMEEKVLSWLMEAWRIDGERKTTIPPYTVAQMHSLLEAITGSSKRVQLRCGIMLPPSLIVDAVDEEMRTKVIRDFQLNAELPPFAPARSSTGAISDTSDLATMDDPDASLGQNIESVNLAPPRGRERRLSAFLLKSLDATHQRLGQDDDSLSKATVETLRFTLDVVVVALFFEGSLLMNGTQPNRRTVQAACKMLGLVSPSLAKEHWEPQERRLLLGALDPLMLADDNHTSDNSWEALVPPGEKSGIRIQVLQRVLHASKSHDTSTMLRRELQRCVFRSADVQSTFAELLKQLRGVLGLTMERVGSEGSTSADDHDDFAPILEVGWSAEASQKVSGALIHYRHITNTCVTALSVLPILQSLSGEPTHDRQLIELLTGCDSSEFLILAPPCLNNIEQKRLHLNASNLKGLLEQVDWLCTQYAYKHNEEAQLLIVRTLEATSHLWRGSLVVDEDLREKIEAYCSQCIALLRNQEQPSWRVRDAIVCFLDRYLALDPAQEYWPSSDVTADLPAAVLPTFGDDDDIRIRFRVAAVSPRLFAVCRLADDKPKDLYNYIRLHLSTSEIHFERILTRLLSLGNMVICDASVRRGAYWHLLEIAFYAKIYCRHLKAVLMGVTMRLGMERFSDLFNSYASQFAYSIRMSNIDIFDFPADLLGYPDRREFAEATFKAFTPTNLLEAGKPEELDAGKDLFARHCQTIQKTEHDGIRECFADLVAHHITHWLERSPENVTDTLLKSKLIEKTRLATQEQVFQDHFRRNVDDIVVAILRTLGDQDISGNGPIVAALREVSMNEAADTFLSITKYRSLDAFDTHQPNLPCYGAHLILRALDWYRGQVEEVDSPATTYHVLHQLFADVERACLVNEQYRSLNALCLWIACHHAHFQDGTLLRVLIRRAAAMLSQCDLARSAQSLLEWSLALYRIYSTQTSHLVADELIHVSTLAHEFSGTVGTPYIAALGKTLMNWIETQAESLYRSKSMRNQVKRALAAWPRALPATLHSYCDDLRLADLISSLGDHGMSSSKFRLVRKMYEIASSDSAEEELEGLGSSDFWRLKAHIPPKGSLVDSDIDAFTSLLILHRGHIDSLGGGKFSPDTVNTRHRRAAEKRAGLSKETVVHADMDSAREATILSLLAMVNTTFGSQVYTAYQTLRFLMSVPSLDDFVMTTLSSDVRRELEYLRAFPKPRAKPALPDLPSILTSEELLHLSSDFPSWVTRIAKLMSDALGSRDPFFSPLESVLLANYSFAEELLPVLVHSLLQVEFDQSASESPNSLKALLSLYFSSVLAYEGAETHCYRVIIGTVLHLRSFQPSTQPRDALSYDKWLSIDFTLLSRRAIGCGAYTTALLFLELGGEYGSTSADGGRGSTEDILFEIYSHIDEPDGFYGIQTRDLRRFFVQRLHHENEWDTAFRYHGAVVESGAAGYTDTNGIVQALHAFGFNRLALHTLQRLFGSSDSLGSSSLAYSLAWRAETWDLPETLASDHSGATLYLAMRAVYRERSQYLVNNVLRHSFLDEMCRLRDLGSENFTEIRQVTQNLMCLGQVRQWTTGDIQKILLADKKDTAILDGFTRMESDFEFPNVEAIMATRISLVRSLLQKEQRDQIGDIRSPLCEVLQRTEKACLLYLSERARDANEPQVALNSVVRALNMEQDPSPSVTREFSNVLWLMKEPKLAIQSLTELANAVEPDVPTDDSTKLQYASLLAQLGTWSAEASLKKPSQIVAECFGPAIDAILASNILATVELGRSAASVFHQYAIFAERQYHAISKSPDALRWKLYIDRKKEEIKQRTHELERLPQKSLERAQLERQQGYAQVLLEQDKHRAQEHLGRRTTFLSLAVKMFSRCLAASDTFDDDSPIRLCSLWLANFDSEEAVLGFDTALVRVPSRKFVFLAHQLTARLSSSEHGSQMILRALIRRMCSEHPFHSLFPLYCIKADHPTDKESPSGRRQSGRHATQTQTQTPAQAERGTTAAEIFAKLSSSGGRPSERVNAVEHICSASLQWAQHPIKALFSKGARPPKQMPVPDKLEIRKVKDIRVPVITAHTPIDPTMEYQDCIWISYYDPIFTTAGGVNLPKITNCVGSDGKKYKQLYKGEGNDDLRQDAVMEQVFDLVNIVLRHNRETKRRKLSVRGYKVIPLAAQAGVLEFVDDTTPLADWLRPAHPRYRPQDLRQDQVSKRMALNYRSEWRDDPEKVIVRFRQVQERFKPVMRHYFTEKHKTPMPWYMMRLHYARSVATNSIVGHILGLGDRHTSNILIDNKTGEVIHIDLGIAFEQGKFLPQPERVPFRLTGDMIDGLGISGTQGVFQRCAEETLRVLRDGSEIILTVLEVFKYDPLHSWTASEFKIKRVQASVSDETLQLTEEAFRFAIGIDMASGAAHEAADRALSTVARKLDKTLSVEYTVNDLITEASDPSNLGLMYMGWAPHM
ncbi:hypothetical protein C8Q79DRAFT_1015032 [Trametes meyenii]|nr:hypothetical protein C8Q79DRAFT_1015032 [Trametes meyenii]